MALDSCDELQRVDDVYLRPRHGECIYRKRVLVPTLSVAVGDMIWIEKVLPKLDIVFELFPDHVQSMSYDGNPWVQSGGLHAVLFDLGTETVNVVQERGY